MTITKRLMFLTTLALAGCGAFDAGKPEWLAIREKAERGGFADHPRYRVTLYSGLGLPIRTIDAGDVSEGGNSDRWEVIDAKTGRHIRLTGTVVVEDVMEPEGNKHP